MDFVTALNKKLEDQRQMLIAALAKGSANDFAEYQHLCGRLRGLADAQGLLNDLAQTLKENDED
jgi:ABC-type glycerol-3-phosphate transport system substrate-binding protein